MPKERLLSGNSGVDEYRREELGRGVPLDWVAIPGRGFQMGSAPAQGDDEERPRHKVMVKPFLMG